MGNIRDFDLNLLRSLRALLQTLSVSRAATELHVSQPAMSGSLRRLRAALGDELLVRRGHEMLPTPLASRLAPQVEELLLRMEEMLFADRAFDPMQWQSTLRIITTDDVVAAFGRPLTTTLAGLAPAVTPVFQTLPADYGIERLQQGSAQLAITVDWTAPQELRRVRLYEDRFVCVVSNAHPFAKHPPKPKAFAQAEHLLVAPLGGTYGPVDQRLADRGLERTVAAVVPNFLAAGPFVAAGQLVCTLPNRTAQVIAAAFELQLFDPPVALPKIRYDLFWHARFDKDPAHVWLRGLAKRVASSM